MPTAWTPSANDSVFTLTHVGSTVYAGGSFTTVNGASRPGVAAFDGTGALTSWNPQPALGAGQAGQVYSLRRVGVDDVHRRRLPHRQRRRHARRSPRSRSRPARRSRRGRRPRTTSSTAIALAPQGLVVGGAFTALGYPPPGSAVLADEPAATYRGGFALVPALPDAPLGVSATAGDASATVSFSAPAFDGGAPITSYTVTASPGGATVTGASSPIVVTGLTNGTAYTFTVTATTGAGTGEASAASSAVTPRAVPGRADRRDGRAPATGRRPSASAPPASDGGAAITLVHGHGVARRADGDGRRQPDRR